MRKDAMLAKGTGYVKGPRQVAGRKLSIHMKYLEYRKRGAEESREDRSLFSATSDHVLRREALDDVMEHTSSSVSYHKIVLSPAHDEPVADWKEWTRAVMRDFEDSKGQRLTWYAVK